MRNGKEWKLRDKSLSSRIFLIQRILTRFRISFDFRVAHTANFYPLANTLPFRDPSTWDENLESSTNIKFQNWFGECLPVCLVSSETKVEYTINSRKIQLGHSIINRLIDY